jgi:hypothetical protein
MAGDGRVEKMNIQATDKRKRLLAITAIIALAVVAVIAIAWNTHTTKADVDCSGTWWHSTDPVVFNACLAAQGPHNDVDPVSEEATAAAYPGTPIDPSFTAVPLLPEWSELTVVYSMPYTSDLQPILPNYSGATTVWRDGSVPTDDYMMWNEFYVLTSPGNGASYVEMGTGQVITITTNPTIKTLVSICGCGDAKYQKVWTDPQADGALYITNITNPAYTNTDPNVPYPGVQSMVYFTTKSGQTGNLNLSTGTWTFDTMSGSVPTPTAILTYP